MRELTLRDVAQLFPDWLCARATSGRLYAKLVCDGGLTVIVNGEDPMDLRDEIIRALSWMERQELART